MKIKTSITLEADLLKRVDDALLERESRSAFFMDAAQQLAEKRERAQRDERDLERLNANAAALNEEALDNVSFVSGLFQGDEEQP